MVVVVSILLNCSILWAPRKLAQIRLLEKVHADYTRRLDGMKEGNECKNYWQRLRILNLYSVERRRERYSIIYVWKALHGLVHNPGLSFHISERRGVICNLPPHTTPQREDSFMVWGPKLFNCMPKFLRNQVATENPVQSVKRFKKTLDDFLATVPDEPNLSGNYSKFINICDNSGRKSNSLFYILKYSPELYTIEL